MNEVMTDTGRTALKRILLLMDEMPAEKLFYILGYMQSEADKNLQSRVKG